MQKDLTIGILNGVYGSLLTARQREIITQYYDYDLSLMEISQNLGISRQGVLDAIKKGSEQLKEYERNLKVVANKQELNDGLNEIVSLINTGKVDDACVLAKSLISKNQE